MPELKSLQYGNEIEETVFERYKNIMADDGVTVVKRGFWIDPSYPDLGCSADGLLYTIDEDKLVGVLEIKC